MRTLVVLFLMALAAFGAAKADGSEMAVTAADAAVQLAGEEAAMQVAEAAANVDEAGVEEVDEEGEEEADEEADEGEDEAEEEEADEAGAEEEASFLEADAEADTEVELDAEGKPLKKPKIVGAVLPPPAPRRRWKYHSERVVEAQTTNPFEDPELGKLNLALEAVKEDILSTNKQINDERKWVIAVAKIIASYNDKMKRVEAHIIALRKEMKQLYKKKKQIENLKLQKALEAKLKEARDELATLTSSLKHVATKQGELNRSGADLRTTIAGIQAQLAKLRGQQIRPKAPAKARKCRKGFRFSRRANKCVARRRRVAKRLAKRK